MIFLPCFQADGADIGIFEKAPFQIIFIPINGDTTPGFHETLTQRAGFRRGFGQGGDLYVFLSRNGSNRTGDGTPDAKNAGTGHGHQTQGQCTGLFQDFR